MDSFAQPSIAPLRQPEGPDARPDVAVLGAGVVGVATAYALARRGLRVALLDKASGPALGVSHANGAQLSYAYSDALGGPSLLRRLPALALGADRLFTVRPSLDPELIAWGLQFLGACTRKAQNAGTLSTLRLALESQKALHDLLDRHPIDFGHEAAGKMHLYFERAALEEAKAGVAMKQAAGVEQHLLTSGEAMALEPALQGVRDLTGAVYSPGDEVGDPHLFCGGLTEILRREYGAQLRYGFEVARMEASEAGFAVTAADGSVLKARAGVVALGPQAGPFLARHGLRTPILGMKGYSFTAPLGVGAPRISLTDTARKIVFCRLSGRMRIAGVAELGTRSLEMDPRRLEDLIAAARASLPEAADYGQVCRPWAGLRPMTPTSTPIIARARPRLVLNVGHGMLGWTLAMGSAERAAELVCESLGAPA